MTGAGLIQPQAAFEGGFNMRQVDAGAVILYSQAKTAFGYLALDVDQSPGMAGGVFDQRAEHFSQILRRHRGAQVFGDIDMKDERFTTLSALDDADQAFNDFQNLGVDR